MLDDICEVGKDKMKALPDTDLGSWKRAVTTSMVHGIYMGFSAKTAHLSFANFSPVLSYGMVMPLCVVVTL